MVYFLTNLTLFKVYLTNFTIIPSLTLPLLLNLAFVSSLNWQLFPHLMLIFLYLALVSLLNWLGNGGICIGINYSVLNEMKQYK